VLRKGGKLLLLEHVRPKGAPGFAADAAASLWMPLAGGCHLNRDTERAVREAGFKVAEKKSYFGMLVSLAAKRT
jgi:hypothetical protein